MSNSETVEERAKKNAERMMENALGYFYSSEVAEKMLTDKGFKMLLKLETDNLKEEFEEAEEAVRKEMSKTCDARWEEAWYQVSTVSPPKTSSDLHTAMMELSDCAVEETTKKVWEEIERDLERKGPCEHPARMWEKPKAGEPFCRVCKEMWNVNQALAEEGKKKSDDCPHPRRCTRWDVKTSRFLCDVCQAVEKAVLEEREVNCKVTCRNCREGLKVEKIGREDYIHWIDNDDTAKYLTNSYSVLCHAANIRRRGEKGK